MKVILLIMMGLSLLQADYIRDDVKEVVLDTTTNLMWQDDNATTSQYTWTNAITQCENLNLGGFSNWRLPNFNELYLLSDRNVANPAISSIFININSYFYWSSTTYVQITTVAWLVNFSYGGGDVGGKNSTLYVRCVR